MIFNAIAQQFQAKKQQKLADKITPVNAKYEANPAATSLYNQGRNLYQGRMEGANALEQNAFTSQANTVANANRNATDASQALAVAAAAQGQTDSTLNNLAIEEGQNKLQRFGALSSATGQMIQEGDKVFQDKLRNYYDDLNKKNSLEAAAMQNRNAIWGALDQTAMAAVSLMSPGGALAGAGKSAGGGGGVGGQASSWGQGNYPMMQSNTFNPNAGASPAGTFGGSVPFNPQTTNQYFPYRQPQQRNFLNG